MSQSTIISDAIRAAHEKGYRVTKSGRVVGLRGGYRKLTESAEGRTRYYRFNVADDRGKRIPIPVHRLAAYQLFGERSMREGIETRHLDGNSLNNRLSNLQLGSPTANRLDEPARVRKQRASHAASFTRRLTSKQAAQLRKDRRRGLSYADLSEKYDLHFSTVSDIVNGRLYQDAPGLG